MDTPPRIPLSTNRCMSMSVSSSSDTPVIFSIASQLNPRCGVIMCRVETVMLHARGAELLEDVGKQKDVRFHVQIVVIAEGVQIERGPYGLGVGVVGVADVGLCETTVEGRLGRQLRLLQSCGPVKVVVREDPLPFQQLGVVGVVLQVCESVGWQVGCHDLWSWIWVHFDYFIISRFLYTKIICTF